MVGVTFRSKDTDGVEVDGGRTMTGRSKDGSRQQITVFIDPDDTLSVNGRDAATGKSVKDHPVTIEELAEHEIGGHARENLAEPGRRRFPEKKAIEAENKFRERLGDSFRRIGHIGRVK